MSELGFTVYNNLASSVRKFLKSQGKNISEQDMDKILQRMADVNSARSKNDSIFSGGHRYFGGSGKDFVVKNGLQVKLSADEYNKIFEGYLEEVQNPAQSAEPKSEIKKLEIPSKDIPSLVPKPKELDITKVKMNTDALKADQFKYSLSQMSDKQLKQIANSDNLTHDINQLGMIAQEIGSRGDQNTARKIAKFMKEIQAEQAAHQEKLAPARPADEAAPPASPLTSARPADEAASSVHESVSDEHIQSRQHPATLQPGSIRRTKNYLSILKSVTTTIKYGSDGMPTVAISDLSEIKNSISGNPNVGYFQRVRPLDILTEMQSDDKFYDIRELKNKNGEVILTYKDGSFYAKNGKTIGHDKAWNIVEKHLSKDNLSQLIQHYKSD